ncbi:type IV pilus modification PilV family protein [Desulfoscipio sp. XC116]|uniref:type IV pilus modification PilV family protein n=1 Tax=Desulfoscipio sp. XC116 TaxID=3144975 RepID=UPI00325B6BBD
MLADKRGFIIMEVLSSILILSICIVAISFAITTSTKQLAVSMQRLKAIEMAHGKLEETIGTEFETITSIPRTDFPASNGSYQYSVYVQNDNDCRYLKRIHVTVYFTESISGLEKTVAIVGARAKR